MSSLNMTIKKCCFLFINLLWNIYMKFIWKVTWLGFFFDVKVIVHSEFHATEPEDHSASLQSDPAAFASISALEETRVVIGQIMTAPPWQWLTTTIV